MERSEASYVVYIDINPQGQKFDEDLDVFILDIVVVIVTWFVSSSINTQACLPVTSSCITNVAESVFHISSSSLI